MGTAVARVSTPSSPPPLHLVLSPRGVQPSSTAKVDSLGYLWSPPPPPFAINLTKAAYSNAASSASTNSWCSLSSNSAQCLKRRRRRRAVRTIARHTHDDADVAPFASSRGTPNPRGAGQTNNPRERRPDRSHTRGVATRVASARRRRERRETQRKAHEGGAAFAADLGRRRRTIRTTTQSLAAVIQWGRAAASARAAHRSSIASRHCAKNSRWSQPCARAKPESWPSNSSRYSPVEWRVKQGSDLLITTQ